MNGPVVAIDLGGTQLRVALVDASGKILARTAEASQAERGPQAVVRRMGELARELMEKERVTAGAVGAGIAGAVDWNGVLRFAPHLWVGVPIRALLEEEFKLPVFVENDANVAALAEQRFSGSPCDDLIYLTISTGVGGGVISGGQLIRGHAGLGAEVGHIYIGPGEFVAECGHSGCLESLVSGPSIVRRAQMGLKGRKSALQGLAESRQAFMATDVFRAAAAGDGYAQEVTGAVAEDLARGIVSLVHIFNPRRVALGGGVMQGWEELGPPTVTAMRRLATPAFIREVEVAVTSLGDDIGLAGCAALVAGGASA